jgi:N-acetyl-gamma-glutamyl-phosphate reductase
VAPRTVGIVGARGYTGAELVRLVAGHPGLSLSFLVSRELAGQPVRDHVSGYDGPLCFENAGPDELLTRGTDAVVLAMPNEKSRDWVTAVETSAPGTVLVDLSADHRFGGWVYGLPERHREQLRGARRIANPGCYATAMQLALGPLVGELAGPAQCFGVSGWSGAGTTPSDRNDPDKLRDNLMPYALTGHVHEREVTRHLGHPVEFLPHVAPHFRGITLTANAHVRAPVTVAALRERYRAVYDPEPLVHVVDDPPWVSRIAGRHGAEVGGFAVSADGLRVVVVCTLDNLLKGAATQAVQNLNLAFGLDEHVGIPWDLS